MVSSIYIVEIETVIVVVVALTKIMTEINEKEAH